MKREKTLRKRVSLRFLAAALIPVCIFAVVSQIRLRMSLGEKMEEHINAGLRSADQCLNMALDKYETILYDMCTDDVITNGAMKLVKGAGDMDTYNRSLRHELIHICSSNKGMEGVTIFLKNGRKIFYDHLSDSFTDTTWADKLKVPEMSGEYAYGGSGRPITVNGSKIYLFQIGRRLLDYRNSSQPLGTVVISINEEQIREALKSQGDNSFCLVDRGTVISAPQESEIGKKYTEIQNTAQNKYGSLVNKKTGFEICDKQPLADYERAVWEQIGFLFVIAVVTCVVMLLSIYLFTKPYLAAVDSLGASMNKLEEGDFDVQIKVPKGMPVEIQKIASGFNDMAIHIEDLIGQVKSSAIEQKNAELSALEAQIDPHFLYNTLDTINWKAIENEQYDISRMVGALADILRYSVKNAGGVTTIRQEMGWLEHYAMLQSAKLGRPLIIEKQVPEELMGYSIHKLLLQPFVENCINHGFNGVDREYRLHIAARLSDDQIHIIVEDNGRGIDKSTLKLLNDEKQEMEGHLGVANVRKRLKLYYGEEAAVYFESVKTSWTKVHLFIPRKEKP